MAAGAGRVSPVVRAAVLGRPIAHSLSPVLHRAAFAALGLEDSEYGRAEVGDEDLAAFLDAHPAETGFSLTMPLKERLVALARERGWDLDETAEATGVANTLVRFPNATTVANTDVDGIVGAIRLRPGSGTRATILGAGATARSALLALVRLGITEVDLLVRSASRAVAAAELGTRLGLAVEIGGLETIRSSAVVVSTLPAEAAPTLTWEPGSGVALDVAYAAESAVLTGASAHGYTAVPGTAMLVEQAVAQAVLFLTAAAGTPPSPAQVEAIAASMHAALPERD
ncbi:shikimate dehydrogenase [Brevibacterium casei]|uniref:Shikimate dehydrogenase n=2 Tax=Brevibacterium casei TaxID=33889 RepID=A0A269ZF82_9MICO|nr:shikimate dehydrogenase [Brevibacterium casei]MCT1765371.1 shikimate dehydrogenase [Brevibacterium casei]PAK96453.1 shikimate dehydrogenase [Brevibacterium casei]QPR40618.1 shikimate dehydrogenase [Brevibacterium casei]QPR44773.1 shikimate dehydrogenase [Brevibacterium casei]SMX71447.1 shikimate dehydrogenase [Brevibacterium casei CIP 102111]